MLTPELINYTNFTICLHLSPSINPCAHNSPECFCHPVTETTIKPNMDYKET